MSRQEASLFGSRWVQRPAHVRELEPTDLPRGFRAAGVATGSNLKAFDVGLLACDEVSCTSAARFTRNAVIGAPVELCLEEGSLDVLRAVVVNSGNANAANGERGIEAARAMRDSAARELGVHPHLVGTASTGVIGEPLATDRLLAGIKLAAAELDSAGGDNFSRAILTTDRGPKRGAVEVKLDGGKAVLSVQTKGAGMIAPQLSAATTLSFIETDAKVTVETLNRLLDLALDRSFNRISVDGQMSTSDSVFAIASGASGVEVKSDSEAAAFGAALEALLLQMALEIVADGEGATKSTRLIVDGAHSDEEAQRIARSVADSALVKTALYGGDVNWGRIVQAAGAAIGSVATQRERAYPTLLVEDVVLCERGEAVELVEDQRERVAMLIKSPELELTLNLGRGSCGSEIFFSDLSHDYVSVNSEYAS